MDIPVAAIFVRYGKDDFEKLDEMKIPNIDAELSQDWLNALCTRIQDSIS